MDQFETAKVQQNIFLQLQNMVLVQNITGTEQLHFSISKMSAFFSPRQLFRIVFFLNLTL